MAMNIFHLETKNGFLTQKVQFVQQLFNRNEGKTDFLNRCMHESVIRTKLALSVAKVTFVFLYSVLLITINLI